LPVAGWADVEVSLDELWDTFSDVRAWPRWNPCIMRARVRGGDLRVGAKLVWVFNAIRRWYPYKLPATARIVEYIPRQRVTWEVRMPGFHALHSYLFADVVSDEVGVGGSRFGSWEIAEGPAYRLLRRFWLAHFRYVRDESLIGARSIAHRRVRLERSGAGGSDQLPLLVIPGIDGQPGSVAPIIERLGQTREVVLVDYSHEVNSSLDDLVAEIAAIAPERCDVLGQSIGTWLAVGVADRLGDRVRKVALISTFTRARGWALRISALLTRITPGPLYRATTPALMALVCGPVGDGRHHPFLDGVARSDREGVARRTRWQIGRDFSADLRRLAPPTLVVMGEADRFVPRRRREIGRLHSIFGHAGSRVVTIPHAGHVLLPTAALERAADEIAGFLG
jgi:pimeloyl-ACP methyl ester carboxylesterase